MANAQNKLKKFVIAGTIHPNYIDVIKTICDGKYLEFEIIKDENTGRTDLEKLKTAVDDQTSAVIVQNPNFYGYLEEVFEIEKIAHSTKKGLYISIIEPVSLAIIEAPGNYNADIVVGEGQPLGISLSYGGPYLGLFACKEKFVRKLPGRITGMTVDQNGEPGFVLTLQTREQQIKREKATSNICTNQGLFMLAATVYMESIGREGLKDVATNSYQNAHYLANEINKIDGFSVDTDSPFVFEFLVKTPVNPQEIIDKGVEAGFLPGVDTKITNDKNLRGLLVAVTEKRNKEEIDGFVNFLRAFTR
jgi:glycine dehydrogenase subunit 1